MILNRKCLIFSFLLVNFVRNSIHKNFENSLNQDINEFTASFLFSFPDMIEYNLPLSSHNIEFSHHNNIENTDFSASENTSTQITNSFQMFSPSQTSTEKQVYLDLPKIIPNNTFQDDLMKIDIEKLLSCESNNDQFMTQLNYYDNKIDSNINICQSNYCDERRTQNIALPNDLIEINTSKFISDDVYAHHSISPSQNLIDTYLNFDNQDNIFGFQTFGANSDDIIQQKKTQTENNSHYDLNIMSQHENGLQNSEHIYHKFNHPISSHSVSTTYRETPYDNLYSESNVQQDFHTMNTRMTDYDFEQETTLMQTARHNLMPNCEFQLSSEVSSSISHENGTNESEIGINQISNFDTDPLEITKQIMQNKMVSEGSKSNTNNRKRKMALKDGEYYAMYPENEKYRILFLKEHLPGGNEIDFLKHKNIENKKILDLLAEHVKNSMEQQSIFDNDEVNKTGNYYSDEILKVISNKLIDIENNIKFETRDLKSWRNSIISKRFNLSGFCSYCPKNICLYTSISSDFDYETECLNLCIEKSNAKIKDEIYSFFYIIERTYQKLRSHSDLFVFLRFFKNLQLELHSLIEKTKEQKVYMKSSIRKEILKNLFHNFSSKNLELKILLIPEFYSLLFNMIIMNLKLNKTSECCIFLAFYFYLRIFDFFFDFISINDHFFDINIYNNERKIKQKIQAYVSFFARIYIIEPLVILLVRSQKIWRRYQLYCFNIFRIECLRMREEKYDSELYKFLKFNIWWICNSDKRIISTKFLNYFNSKKIENNLLANITYFDGIARSIIELRRINSNILSQSLIEKEHMVDLKQFVDFCENWCFTNNDNES